jgi:Na+-transporting methylmalonyl-CoA/oxaloacetate decarboxylase gamma subunit
MLKAVWFVLAGMGIVFATLSALVLVMTVLNRWLTPARAAAAGAGGGLRTRRPPGAGDA